LVQESELFLEHVDGNDVVHCVRERGNGVETFNVILGDGDHCQITQASCLDNNHEGSELCPWVFPWDGEDLVGMVQDLLLASVLDGNQHLSPPFLLLVDLFFGFIQISFSVFDISGSWRGKDCLDRFDPDSFLLQNDGLQILWAHDSEGDCVDVLFDGL
jgi:hypothetical protein